MSMVEQETCGPRVMVSMSILSNFLSLPACDFEMNGGVTMGLKMSYPSICFE